MIGKYQWRVQQIMERLTQEEVEQFKREAEEWNKHKPPVEVQSITLQDNNAEVMVSKRDFNDEFGSGDAFSGHVKVEKEWHNCMAKEVKNRASEDSVSEWEGMDPRYQGHETSTYKGCGRVFKGKHQVPWNSISQDQSKFIRLHYLPHRFKLRESSKLQKDEVVRLLEFWRARQNEDKRDVFTFHQWKNASAETEGRREKEKGKQRIVPSPSPSSIEPSSDDKEEEGNEDRWGSRDKFEDLLINNLSVDQSTHGARSRLDFPKRRLHLDSVQKKPKTIHERLTDPKEAQVEGGWIPLESRGPSMVMNMLDVQGKKSGPPHPQPRIKKKTSTADSKVNQDVLDRSGIKGIDPQPATPSKGKSKRKAGTPKSKKVPKTDTKKEEDEGIRRSVQP
ncbi:hypothetical protein F5I97DRAFT_1826621 [Phlebopus sp. FC_14]|nr:hypothetical protein F5I97DRAFT_1826621 [Phlebopus sp. FC_14]